MQLVTPQSFLNPPFKTIDDLFGLKITIMGLGLNGGGLASARFFAEHGAIVTVTDMKPQEELKPSLERLSDLKIRYVLGKHDIEDFSEADMVIKNPGVKLENNKFLSAAKSIETDISVFLRLTKAPIIAVTGSKGKSSTVSAIHWGLKEVGFNAFLGGNITVSPLTFLNETNEKTPVVLELSSWQLADLQGRNLLKPKVAVITPIMPDHQNWYGSMEAYVADKKLIYANQDKTCYTICNADDSWGEVFASETKGQVLYYSAKPQIFENSNETKYKNYMGGFIGKDGCGYLTWDNEGQTSKSFTEGQTSNTATRGTDLNDSDKRDRPLRKVLPTKVRVPGFHQKENLLNAAQVLSLFGVSDAEILRVLPNFPGIPHRLEFFYEYEGIKFYNDSAATIPEAAAAAIESFEKPPILLAGGTDKVLDFEPLAKRAKKAKAILLLKGTGTDKLIPLLDRENCSFYGPFENLNSLINKALEIAQNDDSIVFSPGATSFGLFKNEFDRGNKFKETTIEVCNERKLSSKAK